MADTASEDTAAVTVSNAMLVKFQLSTDVCHKVDALLVKLTITVNVFLRLLAVLVVVIMVNKVTMAKAFKLVCMDQHIITIQSALILTVMATAVVMDTVARQAVTGAVYLQLTLATKF